MFLSSKDDLCENLGSLTLEDLHVGDFDVVEIYETEELGCKELLVVRETNVQAIVADARLLDILGWSAILCEFLWGGVEKFFEHLAIDSIILVLDDAYLAVGLLICHAGAETEEAFLDFYLWEDFESRCHL